MIFKQIYLIHKGDPNRSWASQMGLWNTQTAPLPKGKTLPMSFLDITLNHLKVWLQ